MVDGRRILVTGASGCIGHYLSDALMQQTDHELFLLVRDPSKLQLSTHCRLGVHVVTGDLRNLDPLKELLGSIHCAILAATAWGDFEVDVTQTLGLIALLDPQVCQQVVYFSTASILSREETLLPEAATLGTPYIQAKALCYEKLQTLALDFPLYLLFPTLVVGGDRHKPYSHLSAGLPQVVKWAKLLRFLKTEGSFHFIHAQDIATVVVALIQHPERAPSRRLVLGQAALTVNEAIATICAFAQQRIGLQLDLKPWLVNLIIRLFRIQMGPWDYFCLNYRHFQYAQPVNPHSFDLPSQTSSLTEMLHQFVPAER